MRPITVMFVLCFAASACRPDPGADPYDGLEIFADAPEVATEFLQGPNPYIPGQERFAFGILYEGGFSESLPVDDQTRWSYIYDLVGDGTGSPTYNVSIDTAERREGLTSDTLIHAGHTWWGGGITWDNSGDLSDWTTLHISFRSSDDAFAEIAISLEGGVSVALQATDYGYTNNGTWHDLSIPLADFAARGVELDNLFRPFALSGGPGLAGEEVRLDNLYLTKE